MFSSKSLKKSLIRSTALIGVTILAAQAPAHAAAIVVNSTTNSPVFLNQGDSVHITNSGSIEDGLGVANDDGVNQVGAIINDGLISVEGDGVELSGAIATSITNNGLITNGGEGIFIGNHGGVSGNIVNHGTITSEGTGIEVDDTSTVQGQLSNSGVIAATDDAGVGVFDHSNIAGGIKNSGLIQGTYAGIDVSNSNLTGGINNSGQITSTDECCGDVGAIVVTDHADVSGGIVNSGLIGGEGEITEEAAPAVIANTNEVGILVTNGSNISGGVTNTATGTISGTSYGIRVTDANISGGVNNSGVIFGDDSGVRVENGGDISGGVTNNAGGVISGFDKGISVRSANISGGVNNAGLIQGDRGINVWDSADISGGVHNTGTISGNDTDGIHVSDDSNISGGVTNSGYIWGDDNGILVKEDSDISAGVTNSATGDISGGSHGVAVRSSSDISGGVTNSGYIWGDNGGVYVYDDSDISGGVTNNAGGTISSGDDGIKVLDHSDISGGVHNAGTIIGEDRNGIALRYFSDISGGVFNASTGTISGPSNGILVTRSSNISGGIDNSGLIASTGDGAAIAIDSGSNVSGGIINRAGGNITGAVGIRFTGTGSGSCGTDCLIPPPGLLNITNSGTITGEFGPAILLNNLQDTVFINLDGGHINGDVIDEQAGDGNSIVRVTNDFQTNGDFQVSDLTVDGGKTFTISGNNLVELDHMSDSDGTFQFEVVHNEAFAGAPAGLLLGNDSSGFLAVDNGPINLDGASVSVKLSAPMHDGEEIWIGDGSSTVIGFNGSTGLSRTTIENTLLFNFYVADGDNSFTCPDDDACSSDNLILGATQTDSVEDAAGGGNKSAGKALDGLLEDGSDDADVNGLLGEIEGAQTQAELDAIIASVSPDVGGGAFDGAIDFINQVSDVTEDAIASGEAGQSSGNASKGMRSWGQVFGNTGNADTHSGTAGFDVKTAGFAVGFDTRNLVKNAIVGAGLSYGRTNVDGDDINTTSTDINSYQFSLYGDYDLGNRTFVRGFASYARDTNDNTRHNVGGIPGLSAKGDYDANEYTVLAKLGRHYSYGMATLTPSFLARWTNYDPQSYTENGAGGLDLNVNQESMNIFELGLGGEASWLYRNPNGSAVSPSLHAGYRYDLVGDRIETTSSFTGGGGAFSTQGADPARSRFNVGAAVTWYQTNAWEIKANYDFDYKQDYTSHSGVLRATYKY